MTDYGGSPVHGAMGLVYRAPNGDEVFMPECEATMLECEFGNVSNQPTDESLGERVLAQITSAKLPDAFIDPALIARYRESNARGVEREFQTPGDFRRPRFAIPERNGEIHCYGTDAADGSGLINNLAPRQPQTGAEFYRDLERTAEYLADCGTFTAPSLTPRCPREDDSVLQEGDARWQRHTGDPKQNAAQHVRTPDTSKPAGSKARWSAAVVAALIALVVVAALCADIFVVPT